MDIKKVIQNGDLIHLTGATVYGYCPGCGIKVEPTEKNPEWDYCECPGAMDLRDESIPLDRPTLEAASELRLCILLQEGPLVICRGDPEHIKAFIEQWAPYYNLTNIQVQKDPVDPDKQIVTGLERR